MATGGNIRNLGPVIFVSCFTTLGSLGLLAPADAAMKLSGVPLRRRYVGVFVLGAVAGALILLPLDLATGDFGGAALGAIFGAITAAAWIVLHAVFTVPSAPRP